MKKISRIQNFIEKILTLEISYPRIWTIDATWSSGARRGRQEARRGLVRSIAVRNRWRRSRQRDQNFHPQQQLAWEPLLHEYSLARRVESALEQKHTAIRNTQG
jgi:hypothetical protein